MWKCHSHILIRITQQKQITIVQVNDLSVNFVNYVANSHRSSQKMFYLQSIKIIEFKL